MLQTLILVTVSHTYHIIVFVFVHLPAHIDIAKQLMIFVILIVFLLGNLLILQWEINRWSMEIQNLMCLYSVQNQSRTII